LRTWWLMAGLVLVEVAPSLLGKLGMSTNVYCTD
jgi:hypothetical protein